MEPEALQVQAKVKKQHDKAVVELLIKRVSLILYLKAKLVILVGKLPSKLLKS